MEKKQIGVKLVFGTIISAAVLLIVVTMLFQALNIGITTRETFEVDDPSLDQICTLNINPDEIILVEQFSGEEWETIDPSDYTTNGKIVTVDADALYG